MNRTPKIIYILADDMGYGDLSCLNENSKLRTPHLDRLAAGGMRFTDAHASSSVCTPSRYSILTGRYNWRSWLKSGVIGGYTRHLIEDGRLTVASFLQQQGYQTACIGKWHLGWEWARNGTDEKDVDFAKPISNGPCDVGFDQFFGISASLDMPPYVYREVEAGDVPRLRRMERPAAWQGVRRTAAHPALRFERRHRRTPQCARGASGGCRRAESLAHAIHRGRTEHAGCATGKCRRPGMGAGLVDQERRNP